MRPAHITVLSWVVSMCLIAAIMLVAVGLRLAGPKHLSGFASSALVVDANGNKGIRK